MNYSYKVLPIVAILFLMSISTASAQEGSFGARVGMGLNPDQFVIGAQFAIGKKAGVARIAPSVDLGFGDNVTTIDFNLDFLFRLKVEDTGFGFFGGGGPTLGFADYKGGSDWSVGLSLVGGMELPHIAGHPSTLEARIGIGDIPDFRLLLAIMF